MSKVISVLVTLAFLAGFDHKISLKIKKAAITKLSQGLAPLPRF